MAILDKLPEQVIVDGFKGTIDFYLYKRIPCARKWPTWRKRSPTPEEAENQVAFAYINKIAGGLPDFVIESAKLMAAGTSFTWKDLVVRAYMSGIEY